MNIKKILLLTCLLLVVCLIFISCEGDCFEHESNEYKNYIEKVAPNTQPVTTNDSEC